MPKRKLGMTERNTRVKRRLRPSIKLEDAPPVNSIQDLIEIGKTIKYYKNIDTVMLWRITPYLEDLESMVGMRKLKETIFFQVMFYIQKMHTRNKNEDYLHTLIMGAPGTGKTTVAKIIGKIYQSLGILSRSGPFKIAYRDDFIAEFLGQTAIKTRKLLKSCLGGVLFIDEVYSLAPRRSDRDSFSKEALDTLTAFLSEHKNDFCCIAAGYEDDIKNCFFGMNKGLERRFPWIHKIEDYKSSELAEIMIKMVKCMNWDLKIDKKQIEEILNVNKIYFKNAGGDIETFLGKCKMVHAKRVFSLGSEHKFIITKEDMDNAMKLVIDLKGEIKDDISWQKMYM